jgi:hypothetical protein
MRASRSHTASHQDETEDAGWETAFYICAMSLKHMCAPMPSYEGSVDVHRVLETYLDIIVHRFPLRFPGFPYQKSERVPRAYPHVTLVTHTYSCMLSRIHVCILLALAHT